jgi:hypothetical protein
MSAFKPHIDTNFELTTDLKGKKLYYRDRLLSRFLTVLFDNIGESSERVEFWQLYFPPTWFVTAKNIFDDKSIPASIAFDVFLRWVQSRIQQAKKNEFDNNLDEVAENLFPEFDPPTWAKILIFVFAMYDPQNRPLSVISHEWSFGYGSRVQTFSAFENDDEAFQKRASEILSAAIRQDIERTLAFVYRIQGFKTIFSKEKLQEYIHQLEDASPSEEQIARRKESLLETFRKMLDYLSSNNPK